MAKSCLNRLNGNITVGCTVPRVGVKNIYLMHTDGIALTTSDFLTTILGVSFASGNRAILVEGYKQNIQITSAIRKTDVSARLDFSVMFKLAGRDVNAVSRVRSLLGNAFYVLAEYQDGTHSFIGFNSPLECSGIDWDSNANAGFMTVTLTAPEGSAGNHLMAVADVAVKSIKASVGG